MSKYQPFQYVLDENRRYGADGLETSALPVLFLGGGGGGGGGGVHWTAVPIVACITTRHILIRVWD